MTSNAQGHHGGYKQYLVIWGWLLAMTVFALIIGEVEAIPHGAKAFLLVGVTLAKIYLIGTFFMHLKTERLNLVMCTFSPLILSVILFFMTYGETMGLTPTHKIDNVSPTFKMPTGHAEGHAEAPAAGEKK